AIISVKVPEPQFEGQTKTKLGNSEVKGIVDSVSMASLSEFFEENPPIAKRIVMKAVEAQRARDAARKAKELVRRKSAFSLGGLPGKLADCSRKSKEETELYIVEGDSAGGCFSGDTEIVLADGRSVSFEQIVDEDKKGVKHFCYTIKNDGSVGIEKITNPRITKKNTEVIKITLDNDKEITCTPDHKFMLRDGSYKEAKDLTKEDSLMPLHKRIEHIIYDKEQCGRTISFMKKILEKEGNLDNFDLMRVKNNDRNILSFETFCSRFFDSNGEKLLEAVNNWNHKIKKIEKLVERIDVYDIEVPGTHNFALASGVFVHNSAKQGRNKEFQAVLPLKGKILNVEKANPVKALSSEEISNLITAIGTGIGEQFDLEKLRYSKIVIMTDADIDGAHITTLLLTFFFRFLPKLIENGNIYLAVPPLYRIRKKEYLYVYNDEELKKIMDKYEGKIDVQRFKGLGEMNPEQLWDTTMNPKTRMFKKITIEDAAIADQVFSKLMGDDVEARRQFIAERAHEANIDV
ncbi:MAG: toprim domain-containing protein, partial [Nanoarchaeota archaeon]